MVPERKRDGSLQRTARSVVRPMCGVQLKDRKRSTDLMFMLGLKETMDHSVIANSVHWYVLRREDGHVLMALDFEVEGQRKKERTKRMWENKEDVEKAG